MSFCPFVLLESRKNTGRFKKNISMIEIKHWEVSIQISQCFFICMSKYVTIRKIRKYQRSSQTVDIVGNSHRL